MKAFTGLQEDIKEYTREKNKMALKWALNLNNQKLPFSHFPSKDEDGTDIYNNSQKCLTE